MASPTPPSNATPRWKYEEQHRIGVAQRSYTTPAVITLVLYFVLWIPGLIANIVYLREANRAERLTGRAPEGKGCLVAMLWVTTILFVGFWGLFFLIFVAGMFAAY